MINNIFNKFSANLFALDSSWFTMNGVGSEDPNAAYIFWGYIRDAANVLLIIALLVIVFSQLTGFLIDNYGIKKILPKFIVATILINLSFVICALAVDFSNLLGYGILGWLNTIHEEIAKNVGTVTPGSVFASILDIVFGVGAAAAGLISSLGVAITSLSGPVILIGILIALLIAVLAIAFVFILLGAREIMCMVLVAISPLAFFCLILPNTQKLFSKWLNMMKSLLAIYPIIATMYGGAKIVRLVIIGNAPNYGGSGVTSFLMLMIGAALPFVPFFLIPSILRKALGAIGGGLEKLKAMGNRGIRSAQKGFQNSNFAQQANARAMKNRFENGKINNHRRKRLDAAAAKKFNGKKFDDLTDDEKKKLGVRAQIASANLAAAGKRAEAANKKLNENARYADKGAVDGLMEKDDADSEIQSDAAKINNHQFFDEFKDEDGNLFKQDGNGDWRKVQEDGSLGEKYDGAKEITDKNGNKYRTNEKGELIKANGEKYKRKEFKSDSGEKYHWQDGKLVNEKGEALKAGKTVYDERGVGYQFAGEKDGESEYRVADIKPSTEIDESATYTSMDGKTAYTMKDGKLVDKDGKEIAEGATVTTSSGRNAGYEYKVGQNGKLELQKSANFQTSDGKNIAFYADGKGGFDLKDVDKVNKANALMQELNVSGMDELKQKLEVTGKAIEKAKEDGNLELETKHSNDYKKIKEAIEALNNSNIASGEIEIGTGDAKVKFSHRQGSGMLAALEGKLENDTAGFKYTDKRGNSHDLRVREDGMLETIPTEAGTPAEIMKSKELLRSTYRNDGSGVFRDIETGNVATENQVATAREDGRIKSYGQLRVEQARAANETQVGNALGVLSTNTAAYNQGALLGAQNKSISSVNSTIGEGQALIVNHTNGVDTATSIEVGAQNANKQFEGVMSGNIAARERKANFVLNSADRADILDIASGVGAVAGLTAVINSATASQAKKDLAKSMLDNGAYVGGGHIDIDTNGRPAVERYVNTFAGRSDSTSLSAGQTAAIQRLTAEERQEVRAVLDGTYNDQQAFLNNPNVSEGQKLYMEQILNGDAIIEARDGGTIDAHMNLATQGQADAANSIIGKTNLQVQQATTVGAIKADNQFKQDIVANAVGEVEMDADVLARQAQNEYNLKTAKNDINITPNISLGYAQSLEKQRFDISQEKMYDEAFKLQSKGELLTELRNPSSDHLGDPNWQRSLLKNIMMKGGDDDIMQFAFDRVRLKTNDPNYNADTERVYDEFYAASEEPTMRAFGKFISDCKNLGVDLDSLPSFKEWCQGTYNLTSGGAAYTYTGSKYGSLSHYVASLGEESLTTASKGYIKFATSNPALGNKYSEKAIMLGMIRNKSDEAQAELRQTIAGWNESNRLEAMRELSDVDIARMTETGWNTIFGSIRNGHLSAFQTKNPRLVAKLRNIETDNPRLWSAIDTAMQDFIKS